MRIRVIRGRLMVSPQLLHTPPRTCVFSSNTGNYLTKLRLKPTSKSEWHSDLQNLVSFVKNFGPQRFRLSRFGHRESPRRQRFTEKRKPADSTAGLHRLKIAHLCVPSMTQAQSVSARWPVRAVPRQSIRRLSLPAPYPAPETAGRRAAGSLPEVLSFLILQGK